MTCLTKIEQEHIHFKWCNENGIKVYPIPVSRSRPDEYYIVVETNGVGKQGQRIFNKKRIQKSVEKVVKNKKVKETEVIPSVWEQIRKLYELLYKPVIEIKK